MLTMIIADDESIVRQGLKNIVHWNDLGIEVIAEARDGQEAYELCQELHPDILFTDIRMPLMDGLEVAMKLEEQGSDIRIVLISGAQDFNYAKTALDIKAEGYVLKPVIVDDLNEVIRKVVNRIKLDRKQQSEMTHLKRQIHEHFPLIRNNFLRNLASGVYVNETSIQNKLEYFKIAIQSDESLLISSLQIDDYENKIEKMSEEDKQLLSFGVTNIIEEIMTNYNSGISFGMSENEFVQIYHQSALSNRKYTEICAEIALCLQNFLKISVSIGVGRMIDKISLIHTSLEDARSALQYKFYTGHNSILDISDIDILNDTSNEGIIPFDLYENENRLMGYIKLGDVEGVAETINNIFGHLNSGRTMTMDYVQGVCFEMTCIASRTVQDLGESMDSIADDRSVVLDTIYRKETIADLKSYMSNLFVMIAQYFSKKYNQKSAKVIRKIKDIIDQKYSGDISVAKISQEIYLTPNYLSMIFKQDTGETISEYITKVRMEHAKSLLKSTDLKILEIAEKVGYEDPHYFSKAFKKYTGIHPQKHRL